MIQTASIALENGQLLVEQGILCDELGSRQRQIVVGVRLSNCRWIRFWQGQASSTCKTQSRELSADLRADGIYREG